MKKNNKNKLDNKKRLFHRYLCRNCGHIRFVEKGGECFLCRRCSSDKIEQMTDIKASYKEVYHG